jgi:hypothetical protein
MTLRKSERRDLDEEEKNIDTARHRLLGTYRGCTAVHDTLC